MSRVMMSRFFMLLLLLFISHGAMAATVLVVGDSLSAGYGLPNGSGWVRLLEQRLMAESADVAIINASISGETTAGGKRRIGDLLQRHQPQVVVLELGANDGLRGIQLPLIKQNLNAIVSACEAHGSKILVVGMRIPPNYGREYGEKFHAMFREISERFGTGLVPFMLDGFADDRDLFQDDGIHPNAAAQPLIMENVYQRLKPLL